MIYDGQKRCKQCKHFLVVHPEQVGYEYKQAIGHCSLLEKDAVRGNYSECNTEYFEIDKSLLTYKYLPHTDAMNINKPRLITYLDDTVGFLTEEEALKDFQICQQKASNKYDKIHDELRKLMKKHKFTIEYHISSGNTFDKDDYLYINVDGFEYKI